MKEKLIGLIQDAVGGCARHWAEVIADHLLEQGAILPPCKVGDTVWWVTSVADEYCVEKTDIFVGKVVSFSADEKGLWAYCCYEGGLNFWHKVAEDFSKTVFLSAEEAAQALKERESVCPITR